jgi:hypothetical protein
VLDAELVANGPLFDGRAERALQDYVDAVERRIADVVAARVRAVVDSSARESTGYYRDRVTAEPRGRDWVATDRGARPGPWLEGTTSRNARTGFRGWASWRQARQEAERQALPRIAAQEWNIHKRRME